MSVEAVDVLVIGAGLSGIAAGYYLQSRCPGTTFAILEGRAALGGTWDLFRYPGVRSDSDMFTLGYRFYPWRSERMIADGESIRRYIEEAADAFDLKKHVRFSHRVVRADWSSREARWRVTVEVGPEKRRVEFVCRFLYTCTGYYDYEQGYTPEFVGRERFGGAVIHPQHWPRDASFEGKRVVVIGSGATAITLVPALAKSAAHVVMLQRSPTYVVSLPGVDPIARALRRALPERVAYAATRWKNIVSNMAFYELAQRAPKLTRKLIRAGVRRALGGDPSIDTHFNPRYNPWDERVCLTPDGDFFQALRDKRASVVTDTIETWTERGIQLASGAHIDADVIVTATGLRAKLLCGLDLYVDGERVSVGERVAYKGMMYSDVPNLAFAIGYTNASWTLKCELSAEHLCKLLEHMRANKIDRVTPRLRDQAMQRKPVLDLSAGYIQRSLDALPKQGARAPWRVHQNYLRDLLTYRYGKLVEPELEFASAPRATDAATSNPASTGHV